MGLVKVISCTLEWLWKAAVHTSLFEGEDWRLFGGLLYLIAGIFSRPVKSAPDEMEDVAWFVRANHGYSAVQLRAGFQVFYVPSLPSSWAASYSRDLGSRAVNSSGILSSQNIFGSGMGNSILRHGYFHVHVGDRFPTLSTIGGVEMLTGRPGKPSYS